MRGSGYPTLADEGGWRRVQGVGGTHLLPRLGGGGAERTRRVYEDQRRQFPDNPTNTKIKNARPTVTAAIGTPAPQHLGAGYSSAVPWRYAIGNPKVVPKAAART